MKTIRFMAASMLLAGCASTEQPVIAPPAPVQPAVPVENTVAMLVDSISASEIAARVAQFAPAMLDFDDRTLANWEKQVLAKLVDASRIIHDIYNIQVAPQNPAWRAQLASATGPGKEAALEYFDIM